MPTYEYECRSCGHRFEKFQPITAGSTLGCPKCRKRARRLISSGAGLLFKGGGFYITDYRSDSYKKRASEDKPSKAKAKESSPSKKKKAQ